MDRSVLREVLGNLLQSTVELTRSERCGNIHHPQGNSRCPCTTVRLQNSAGRSTLHVLFLLQWFRTASLNGFQLTTTTSSHFKFCTFKNVVNSKSCCFIGKRMLYTMSALVTTRNFLLLLPQRSSMHTVHVTHDIDNVSGVLLGKNKPIVGRTTRSLHQRFFLIRMKNRVMWTSCSLHVPHVVCHMSHSKFPSFTA